MNVSPKYGFDIDIDSNHAWENQDEIVDWLKKNVGRGWWDWYKDKHHVLHFKLRFA